MSFGTQVQPIFTTSCALAGCHTGAIPAAGMNLSSGHAYSNLVNAMTSSCTTAMIRVTPSNVAASYVINKLTGVGMCSGNQMPARGSSLPTSQIDLIEAWICGGAPNN